MKNNNGHFFKILIEDWLGHKELIDLKNYDLHKYFSILNTLLVYIGEYAKKDWKDSLSQFKFYLMKAYDEMIKIQERHKYSQYNIYVKGIAEEFRKSNKKNLKGEKKCI